jgi:hypothetical protein
MEKTLYDYLAEVQLGSDLSLNNIFNVALSQVFSKNYLQTINNIINKTIKLKYVNKRNSDIVAYNVGNKIFVNQKVFEEYNMKDRIRILLHEFIHMIQRKKRLLFFKEFKPINDLTDKLYDIAKKNLLKSFPIFLTGRNINIGPGGKHEILAYLMNDTINWEAITKEGKDQIIDALKNSGIFNLSHPFWKKRLT